MARDEGLVRLFADLKRRKVFRASAVYGATAFVVMQAADLVFPRLGLPDWTVTLVVALSLLGFPLALAAAWTLERTPAGLRRTEHADPEELERVLTVPRTRRWFATAGALGGVLLLLCAAGWIVVGDRARTYDSIAVLPFVNLSGQEENEYFGDGLAEELINALSGIEGLKVAARTSAFSFKNTQTDMLTIGTALGVATVLEGSVRRSADRLRITAQLIDARTGFHLWADTYDRPLAELFSVQDEIAREIVDALAVRLAVAQRDSLYRGGTGSVEAYDLYLLGRQKWATREVPLLHEAVGHFEGAIARDSSFALAWSGLADAIDALAWRVPELRSRVPEARRAAQRALALDPQLAAGWASLGVLASDYDRDHRLAELALRRAVALKPSYAQGYGWLSTVLRFSGRFDEALEAGRRGLELDPIAGAPTQGYAQLLQGLGRREEARELLLRLRAIGWKETTTALDLVVHARDLGFTPGQAARYALDWAALAGYSDPDGAAVLGHALWDPSLRPAAAGVLDRMDGEGVLFRELAELAVALGEHERPSLFSSGRMEMMMRG